ncbi:MAG: hypothetical protein ACTHJ6_08335 [Oryzihumus sp.]
MRNLTLRRALARELGAVRLTQASDLGPPDQAKEAVASRCWAG